MKEHFLKKLSTHEIFKEGFHLALTNKKTGRLASSNTWQLSLASYAIKTTDQDGILCLLPQTKAKKLLKYNHLQYKKRRGTHLNTASELARSQAKAFIPILIIFYKDAMPSYKTFRAYEFSKWIVKSLNDRNSSATIYANQNGFDELIDKVPSARWWQDQLNKMQS